METTTQIYLEITTENGQLLGEAIAAGYEKRIDIDGFNLSIGSGTKGSVKDVKNKSAVGTLDFDRISIEKVFDRSSLLLAGMLSRHEKFKEAKISVDQQFVLGDDENKIRNEVLIIHLYSGWVADIKLRTSEGNKGASIKESIALSFHRFDVDYWGYQVDQRTRQPWRRLSLEIQGLPEPFQRATGLSHGQRDPVSQVRRRERTPSRRGRIARRRAL